MKRLAIVLLGLLVASAAQAQGANIVTRNGVCYNATTGNLVDCTTGAVIVSDAARDRDYAVEYSNIISKALVPQTGVDSSAVLFTGDCKRWYLQVRVSGFGSGAAIPWATFGIRVRSHIQGVNDSLNTIRWDPTPLRVSETADSLNIGFVSKGSAAVVGQDEIKLTATADNGVAVAVGGWNGPHNYLIPLKDSMGNWYEGQWTSIWVKSLAASANVNHTVTISLVGKP